MTTHRYPPAVVEAAARALAKQRLDGDLWDDVLDRQMKHFYLQDATAALDAAFAAWEGVTDEYPGDGTPCIILPLPQENT